MLPELSAGGDAGGLEGRLMEGLIKFLKTPQGLKPPFSMGLTAWLKPRPSETLIRGSLSTDLHRVEQE